MPASIKGYQNWIATLTNQTATRTDATNAILLGLADASGSMIVQIDAHPLGNNVKSVILIYQELPGNAARTKIAELDLPAISSASLTTKIDSQALILPDIPTPVGAKGIPLSANSKIWVALGTSVASGVALVFRVGDLEFT